VAAASASGILLSPFLALARSGAGVATVLRREGGVPGERSYFPATSHIGNLGVTASSTDFVANN
jgi:hypothetical protein